MSTLTALFKRPSVPAAQENALSLRSVVVSNISAIEGRVGVHLSFAFPKGGAHISAEYEVRAAVSPDGASVEIADILHLTPGLDVPELIVRLYAQHAISDYRIRCHVTSLGQVQGPIYNNGLLEPGAMGSKW